MAQPESLLDFRVNLSAMRDEIVARQKRLAAYVHEQKTILEEKKKDLRSFFESTDIHEFLSTIVVMDKMGMGIDWKEIVRITRYDKLAYGCFYESSARIHESEVREFFGDRTDLVDTFGAFLNRGYHPQHNPGGAFDLDDRSAFAHLPLPMFNQVCARFRMDAVVRKILAMDVSPENKRMVFEHHADRWLAPEYAPYIEAIVGFVERRLEPRTIAMMKDAFTRAIPPPSPIPNIDSV